MDWEHKADALAALCDFSLQYRAPADRIGLAEPWYVEQAVQVREKDTMCGTYGNGFTPQEAIEDHWKRLVTDLPHEHYLVVRQGGHPRRAVRWNGFMWADVIEPDKAAA